MNDHFTLMIVPDAHSEVRRVQVEKRKVYVASLLALGVVSVVLAVAVHYSFLLHEAFTADELRVENERLKTEVSALADRVAAVDAHLADVRRFDEKLRSMTDLRDDGRELAMGPLRQGETPLSATAHSDHPFAVPAEREDPVTRSLTRTLLDSRLDGLELEAMRQASSLGEMVDLFNRRDGLLPSTPTTWPAKGWITSTFGPREDPFTGERIMHLGIDLAAPEGAQVRAPAAGTVTFVGERAAYGNMIAIDHGRGIATHYAHLSRVLVKVGDVVERGQHIGGVGNTGRSTGPHLHYEVRVNGVPVNPRRYVLE
jgi:murein DD-endopeptidase MepM/ murein hydrolase activator NlpD